MNRRHATVALLLGCIVLLQYHSIQFWREVDALTGPVFSVLLEGTALWLWFDRRRAYRVAGGITTLLLLAGPLYVLSAPLVAEWQAVAAGGVAQGDRRAVLDREIAALELELATYRANSKARRGWDGLITSTSTDLSAARAERARLMSAAAEPPPRMDVQRVVIIVMQLMAVSLFQLVAVLCIAELRVLPAAASVPRGRGAERRPLFAIVR